MMRGGGRGGGGGIEAALGAAAGSFLAGAWGAAGAMMAQGSGNIAVATDKPVYFPGEMVTGTVYLTVSSPLIANAVVVRCNGMELTHWENEKTEWEVRIDLACAEAIQRTGSAHSAGKA